MANIIGGYLYIYYKDLKASCQKKIIKYMKNADVKNVELITNNEQPVIIIGEYDDTSPPDLLNSMVS